MVLNEDDQFASYVDPLLAADAIDWTAEYKVSFQGDLIATLNGHMVRDGGSTVSFTVPDEDGDVVIDYRIVGDRVLIQPANVSAEVKNCWLDTTGNARGLRGLPPQLDPLAALEGADVTRARLDEVAVALPGSAGMSVFPRVMVQGLPSAPKDARTEALVRSDSERVLSYEVELIDVAIGFPRGALTEKQFRRFGSAFLTMTVAASDDTQPIVEPPAASVLQPREHPTMPCPASA